LLFAEYAVTPQTASTSPFWQHARFFAWEFRVDLQSHAEPPYARIRMSVTMAKGAV
jgi:hypothetical protein